MEGVYPMTTRSVWDWLIEAQFMVRGDNGAAAVPHPYLAFMYSHDRSMSSRKTPISTSESLLI